MHSLNLSKALTHIESFPNKKSKALTHIESFPNKKTFKVRNSFPIKL